MNDQPTHAEAVSVIAEMQEEIEILRLALQAILRYPKIKEYVGNQIYDLCVDALEESK